VLLGSYVEALRRAGRQSARDVEAMFTRHVLEPWPELADAPAASIEATQIRDILARLVQLGIRRQTNVLRSYLQAAFTHGAHADLDPRQPAAVRFMLAGNPVAFVPRIAEFEDTRERVLSDAELRHMWNGLDKLRPEVALTFRCAILLGGQRLRQLLRAKWSDYDEQRRILTLQDPKGRRKSALSHLLPVLGRVAEMLSVLRCFNGHGGYIFSVNAGRSPMHTATLSISFAGLRSGTSDEPNATPAQARDLRRTIETRLQALGVDREVRAQLLSHGRTAGVQQQHYERHDFLPEKAAALALLEQHLLEVIGYEPRKRRRRTLDSPRGAARSIPPKVHKRSS
jgi:integrase